LTVGNVTAARENALRAALLEGYEMGTFPWVSASAPKELGY
jgi:Leu/Phe-tRNA-protein transferase